MQITNDKVLEALIEIKTQVAEIAANQRNFQTIISNHESRIMKLEETNTSEKDEKDEKEDDFKTELLKLLAKCLMIGLTAICSLAGAGGILSKILCS